MRLGTVNPSISAAMEDDKKFADFDDETIYGKSQARACLATTLNFAVEFGKEEARIAFDLSANDVQALLESSAPQGRPVRWMWVVLSVCKNEN
jgi:hypothetical protein